MLLLALRELDPIIYEPEPGFRRVCGAGGASRYRKSPTHSRAEKPTSPSPSAKHLGHISDVACVRPKDLVRHLPDRLDESGDEFMIEKRREDEGIL
jgi:hypothetical protein